MKLNYKRTFLVGLAFLSICAFWQMYDNIVPLILQGTFHLNETLTGAIMAADNVLAVFLLPLLGSLSDKADTRWGKRTPFIVVGTVLAVVLMMLISFFAAIFFTEYHAVINLGFALIGMGWAAVSVNSLPMVVEMCSSEDVGKYTGLYYTFSMSAQIVTPILSGVFLQYVSYRTLFPYACVFTVAAMITMSMVYHGDNKPERKKNLLENLT